MHIVLIYPPPWKIAVPGEVLSDHSEGPPVGLDSARCLSGDILNIPYGLLSLAAQARAAGHSVTVLNLFAFAWQDIKRILEHYPADLFGLSCFTSNRRGTLYVSHLIKKLYPDAHVSVGGPHASAFPVEMLQHCEALDTVVVGEGEETFAELIGRLEEGFAVSGIAGSVWREGGTITAGPPRKRIAKLDRLVPPFDHFNEYILLTSRGCPWDCTFCASTCMWGRAHHYHSASYVLDMLETIVNGNGQKAVAVKDETFTDNREHVFSICRGIRERGLNFIWSCDTRADRLDEELLAAMRLAGCQRLSLGVESASPKILASLNKRSSPEEVRRATALAKQFGFQIRFYMIGGSRGETRQTLQESIDFVQSVKPSQAVFSPFTLFPGTRDFALAEQDGKVSRNLFFTSDFFELNPLLFEDRQGDAGYILSWLIQHQGVHEVWDYGVRAREEVAARLPDLSSACLDLAQACYVAGDLDRAEQQARKALDLGYPLEGLVYNYFACIAASRGDLQGALEHLIRARESGFYSVVETNLERAQHWIKTGGPGRGLPLDLTASHSFEVTRPKQQPMTPGPIELEGQTRINAVVF